MIQYGYGIELVFNYVWGDDGGLRNDILEKPVLITFRLHGVESVKFSGGLTPGMKSDPGRIDWGLTEVARVEPFESLVGHGLSVQWESVRQLDIEYSDHEIVLPVEIDGLS